MDVKIGTLVSASEREDFCALYSVLHGMLYRTIHEPAYFTGVVSGLSQL